MTCDLCRVNLTEKEIQAGKGNLFPVGYYLPEGEFIGRHICARCINAILLKFGKPAQPTPQPQQSQPVQHPFVSPLEEAVRNVNQLPQQPLQQPPQQPPNIQPKPEPPVVPGSGYKLKRGNVDGDSV